jgi:hypothetical protein
MDVKIDQTSEAERRIADELRRRAVRLVGEGTLCVQQFADRLGLLPTGGKILLERSEWPVEVAIRVAEALEIPVELRT